MKQNITLKEIASLANVSPATVSRVINQNGRFTKETEQRVKSIIKKYEYSPNQLAKGLRTNHSRIIAVIVPDITNIYFANLILAIQTRLFAKDYPVVIYNTNESKEVEQKCLNYIRAQSVSGVIYINGNEDIEDEFLKTVPTIYIDRAPKKDNLPHAQYVYSQNEYGGYLATKALIECGCRKPAVLTERYGTFVMRQRYEGYKKALKETGIDNIESRVFIPTAISYDAAYKIISDAINDGVEFDGLFCQTDWLASGAIDALLAHNIKVPQQVKVVGFDNIPISYLSHLPFSTIEQKSAMIGHYVADTIIDMIDGINNLDLIKEFPVEYIKRETT
ncbi:MAG: LacI family DNA-binding transcriptional regulator [Candidatus Limivicinus sp.]|nr:LacI family DNA-binding transcriptional regulator [Candidatus Limivicinus sp.]